MDNLMTITELVKETLTKDMKARNSDNYLYLMVCERMSVEIGVDISNLPVPVFFLHAKQYGFPAFESVRRSRQKIQAEYPELAGCKDVEKQRTINESKYREYARGQCKGEK